jgi:hypothetical protein
MFTLLILVCAAHEVYTTLEAKVDRWPLRIIYIRLIEFFGRVALVPFIVGYLITTINFPASSDYIIRATVTALVIFGIFVFLREYAGVVSSFTSAWKKLRDKLADLLEKIQEIENDMKVNVANLGYLDSIDSLKMMKDELSFVERFVCNFVLFGRISISCEHLRDVFVSRPSNSDKGQDKNNTAAAVLSSPSGSKAAVNNQRSLSLEDSDEEVEINGLGTIYKAYELRDYSADSDLRRNKQSRR